MTSVAVLCGGLATRLGERAKLKPKFLLPVAGQCFGHWLLRRIADCGLREIVLLVGHLEDQIRQAIGDGSTLGVRVSYVSDGPTPAGTRGAVEGALAQLSDPFLLTYGDSYLPFDYQLPLRELDRVPGAQACMSVYANHNRLEPSNCMVLGDHVVGYAKQRDLKGPCNYIDYGAIAFRTAALLPRVGGDLAPLLSHLAATGQLAAAIAHERFYEVGSHDGIHHLEAYLSDRHRTLG